MYGGGASTLYETLTEQGVDMENPELLKKYKVKNGKELAQKYIDMYFDAYKGVANFIKNQKKFAHRYGYVNTIIGRKKHLPDINSSDIAKMSYNERLSVNSTIQGCIDINTYILTDKGYIPIKDLNNKHYKLITTFSETDNYKVWDSGIKMLYKLVTTHTEIEATEEHKFMVYDNAELIFKNLKDLKPNDLIVMKDYKPTLTSNNYEMNEYELLGALIGDGNYSQKDRNTFRIAGGNEKINYLLEISDFLEKKFNYKPRFFKNKGSKGNAYCIKFENKNIGNLILNELKLEKAVGREKKLPEHILVSSPDVKCSVLRGLFNTDGGWCGDELTFTSISKKLTQQVHLLLNSLGIKARFKEQKDCYRVFVEKNSYELFNNLISFKISSKKEKLEKFINKVSTKEYVPQDLVKYAFTLIYNNEVYKNLNKKEKSAVLRFKVGSASRQQVLKYLKLCNPTKEITNLINILERVYFTKVISITPLEERQTMDIEIFTDDHSYISNGLVSHNSAADITINAQIKIYKQERLKEIGCNMLIQIHDKQFCRV